MEMLDTFTTSKKFLKKVTWLIPNGGTVLIVLLLIATQSIWAKEANTNQAAMASTNTISYQGQLTNAAGTPLNGDYDLTFRLYNVANGGTSLWMEQWIGVNNVTVTNGLFHVMLGSLTTIPQTVFTDNSNLWLSVKVGADNEMTPRIQLGSVPFAIRAATTDETFYELSLTSWITTTTTISANFGTINLPTMSNLHIASMWVLQNTAFNFGLVARLEIDGTPYAFYGDVVPLSTAGIGFTIARNHYVENLAPGNHTVNVRIDQFVGRTGDYIGIGPNSTIWIRAVPVAP